MGGRGTPFVFSSLYLWGRGIGAKRDTPLRSGFLVYISGDGGSAPSGTPPFVFLYLRGRGIQGCNSHAYG